MSSTIFSKAPPPSLTWLQHHECEVVCQRALNRQITRRWEISTRMSARVMFPRWLGNARGDRGKRLRLPSCVLIETDSKGDRAHPDRRYSSRFRCRLASTHPDLTSR